MGGDRAGISAYVDALQNRSVSSLAAEFPLRQGVTGAGVPDNVIQGGRHRQTEVDGTLNGTESHHLIADEISPIATNDALAIRMEITDHKLRSGTWGNLGESNVNRELQQAHIQAGRYDEALQLGIDLVSAGNGTRYDAAIQQALDSAPRKADGSIDWSLFDQKKKKK